MYLDYILVMAFADKEPNRSQKIVVSSDGTTAKAFSDLKQKYEREFLKMQTK